MTAADQWTLGRRPALDGVRGLAVLLVLLGHAGVGVVHTAGRVGVTVFFTLSGFLITALLLRELETSGRMDLRGFYTRRARRLLPALLVFLSSMVLVTLLSDRSTAPPWQDYLGAIFYVANYVISLRGHDNVIGHTWSLSIEEQFYIAWPFVVLLVLGSRRSPRRWMMLMSAALLGCVVSLALRLALWDGGDGWRRIYYGTDTRMDGLLWGCLLAIYMSRRPTTRNRPVVALLSLGTIMALSFGTGRTEHLWVPTCVPLLTVVAIWALCQQQGGRLMTNRVLRYFGRRSYALYLWHFPLFGAAVTLPSPVRWPAVALAALVSVLVAEMSWRCVEEPFLRFKGSGAPQAPRAPHERSAAGNDAPGQVLV